MGIKRSFLLPIRTGLPGLAILLAILGGGRVSSAQYTATALPEGFVANCINNHDEVFGNLGTDVAVWRSGDLEILPRHPQGDGHEVWDCNDRGQVLGIARSGPTPRVLWTDGVPEVVPMLSIGNMARPLNELGEGVVRIEDGQRLDGVWHLDGSITPIDPPFENPTFSGSTALYGINDGGRVVGVTLQSFPGLLRHEPFVWQDGQSTQLPLPTLAGHTFDDADFMFINNADEIFGRATFESPGGDPVYRLFYWHDGVMLDVPVPSTTGAQATDVNDLGQVVGWASPEGAFVGDSSGTSLIEIDASDPLAAEISGLVNSRALSINDAGKIILVGNGSSYLLAPAGEPIRWVNAAGGSWDDASNWDPEQVPGESDRTIFDLAESYAVNFPAAAAASSLASRGVETCASPRSVQSTQVRAGVLTYTGAVDVSTLSDSVADPGLRIGGSADFDDPELRLESGELCSLFSTVGDTSVSGTAAVTLLGGEWSNQGQLRVGDAGQGRLTIEGGSVVAGETRIGNSWGGEVAVLGGDAEFDTGALLLGAPGMNGDSTLTVSDEASVRSDNVLIGARTVECLDDFGLNTDVPCAADRDCAALGDFAFCPGKHKVEVHSEWTAFDPVLVGGGTLVADDGTAFAVAGHGELRVGTGASASVAALDLGTHSVSAADSAKTVSRGLATVFGTLDVLGPMQVGAGGAGILEIERAGRVESTGTATVGIPVAGRILLADDPHFPLIPFLHGQVTVGHSSPAGPIATSLWRAPRISIRLRGLVWLDGGRIEASEQMRVRAGGQLTGVGTVATPDFDVAATGRLGPVFPVVVNRSRVPRGVPEPTGLTIEGNLNLDPGAVLVIEAGGPGFCGKVHVTGDAVLAGTLEVNFAEGYLPAAGDGCNVVTVEGSTTGGFERVVARGVAEGFVYEATANPDGSIDFEALSAATACAGGDLDGDGIADCEHCDNCVDDTGNGLVDRDDPDCVPPADGAGQGLADAGRAAALLKCHRGLQSATQQLATKTWKGLQRCTDAMAKCHQRRPDDPQCLVKAEAKCARAAAKLASAKGPEAKARARIEKDCGVLPIEAILDAAGLGHETNAAPCGSFGVNSLGSAADVAACATRRQLCQLGGLVGVATPRTSELLAAAGVGDAIPCLTAGADGAGAGLGDPKGAGKHAVSCQKAVAKAAGKLLGQTLSAAGRCEASSLACVQRQPGDAGCLDRAGSVCAKEREKLASAETKLHAAFDKRCGDKRGEPLVVLGDLLADAGLGFGASAERCEALGVPVLDSRVAVGACLILENQCRAGQLGAAATPRSLELLSLGGLE